jgi:hypothetical protein
VSGELEKYEVNGKQLAKLYSGFETAEDLTDEEKLMSILSLIPMAFQVMDEARDTIARLRDENERLRNETQ